MGAEETEDVKPKLNISVDFEGTICTVKVKPTTPFKKIFEAAEKRFQKEPGTFKFTFAGKRLSPEEKPADHDMEDGDTIDAHLQQIGGFI
ncbi:ubiquitin-like protein [Abortiporus biennis]|nr:ubiquitin-like protein [Abortiporus biennis]